MRLVTYRVGGGPWRPGVIVVDDVVPLPWASMRDLLAAAPDLVAAVEAARRESDMSAASRDRLADVELSAPVPDPDKILCVGLNYREHVAEVGETVPDVPALFPKFRNGLVGHDGEITVHPDRDVDYEAELAVVIGRRASHLREEHALDHVAGITAFNDVSARDLQFATTQWTAGKIPDTFAPCGPWLVTLDEVGDVQDLAIETRLNGVTVQSANTSDMLFTVQQLVAFVSRIVTLEPGDIIATGTPSGVGMGRTPPTYMKSGDTVEVAIQHVGTLRNRLVEAGVSSHGAAV